ncbi:efflux RND transporter permease subunit [bacterium]|nr:efflux RND transporter permease subunit [bacterium]
MNLSNVALRRPVTTVMVFLSLFLLGGISSRMLPLEFLPDVDFPGIFIQIPYQNSTPREVEDLITIPLEEVLGTMSAVRRMDSNSDENGVGINLRFDWGEDTSIKAMEAKEKIEGIWNQLPSDLERYFVFKFSSSDIPIMNLRLSSNRDLSNSYDLLDRMVKKRIERISGVSKVELHGVEKKEITIDLIADRVLAHKVNIGQLQQSLREANLSFTAGKITDGQRRYNVRPLVEFRSLDEIANLTVSSQGLRLKDVANVRYDDPELNYGRHLDRKYAIGLEIFKEAGANTVEVGKRIIAAIQEIETSDEMQGINLFFMDNAAEGIVSSINELLKSGLWGALFAVMVLYFFLRRISTTLIVALAIPFSLVITMGLMYFLNMSLNILTMMGLMLSVGMLVDNAVVITESIFRHQQFGQDPVEATSTGIKEVGLAVAAATSTTAIVFLPFIMAPEGEVATYMKHVSLTIIIALAASLLIAQTLIPLLTSRLKQTGRKEDKQELFYRLSTRYERILKWTLAHPGYATLIIIGILISTALPIMNVNIDMFPDRDDRRLYLRYYVKANYNVEKVEAAVDVIEEYLYANKERFDIESVYSYYQTGYAMSTLILTKEDDAKKSEAELRKEIMEDLPKVAIGAPSFERRSSSGNEETISLQLWGDSSELLAELSEDMKWRLSKIPGLHDISSSVEGGDREVHVKVNQEQAQQHQFSASQVGQIIAVAMRGQNLTRFRTPTGEIEMRLRLQDSDRENLEQLKRMVIYDDFGKPVELATLANFSWRRGPQHIRRIDRQTTIEIKAGLDDLSVKDARKRIEKHLAGYELPPGYSWGFGRRFQREDETAKIMLVNMILALILIYFVMASLFESLIYPAAIWTSIIFAIVGTFWFFWITGTTFSLMAWIGVFILIGIVVNNGIVLIDHINQLRTEGLARKEAIVKAALNRIRPILMTTGTTVLGLIPLSIGKALIGGDGPPYFPMARSIMGGLLFSTVVTLIILPTIYVGLDDLKLWGRRVLKSATGQTKVTNTKDIVPSS